MARRQSMSGRYGIDVSVGWENRSDADLLSAGAIVDMNSSRPLREPIGEGS